MTVISATSQDIDSWLHSSGFSLGSNQFTFSVSNAQSTWPGYVAGSEPFNVAYSPADAALATAFRSAIGVWDAIIAPDFVERTDTAGTSGEVRVAYTDVGGSLGYAYSGPPRPPGSAVGDIWMSASAKGDDWSPGGQDFAGLLHEIGHTLGLKHTFEAPVVPAALDDTRYSIMSYTTPGLFWTFSQSGNSIRSTSAFPWAITPMVLDIAAAQAIYGAETTTRTGDDTYTFTQWAPVLQTIYDAGGNDTIDLANFTLPSVIDLRPGAYSSLGMADAAAQTAYWSAQFPTFSSFIASTIGGTAQLYTFTDNLGIALGTTIENARGGSGADRITGNAVANVLTGGLGNDTIDGGGTSTRRSCQGCARAMW